MKEMRIRERLKFILTSRLILEASLRDMEVERSFCMECLQRTLNVYGRYLKESFHDDH